MGYLTQGRVAVQVESLRRQFAQSPGLPFGDVLDPAEVEQLLREEAVEGRDRIFTPWVTLRLLLAQAIDADCSCQQALNRLLAERAAQGQSAISANTGGYCQARQRLPESMLHRLMRKVGHGLLQKAPPPWLWKNRVVKLVDGSTASLADTAENQAAYPQPTSQKPGLGFPLLRLLVVFSLAVGTVLEAVVCPYQGKLTSENALLRQVHDHFNPGDILLGDAFFGSYFELALLQQRGVDAVVHFSAAWHNTFTRQRRRGARDWLVTWNKPKRPSWMDKATYKQLPAQLSLRVVRVRVAIPGFRTDTVTLVTTLLDAKEISADDLADLYRARWHAELDLRSLKITLQMDPLRAQSPAMARKELWARLLAYNLIRTVIAQAAQRTRQLPRNLSFKGAVQTLNTFAPYILNARPEQVTKLADRVLAAIAQHRVADRPDRYEPRACKRRRKHYPYLDRPRSAARKHLAAGGYG